MATSKYIKTKDGVTHKIDEAGNHFINGKCMNPTCVDGREIGETYPDEDLIVKP